MTSGMGVRGTMGRCYGFWMDFQQCKVRSNILILVFIILVSMEYNTFNIFSNIFFSDNTSENILSTIIITARIFRGMGGSKNGPLH